MSQDSYGFVGLGNMGGPMAANIAAAGHDLVVYDIAGGAARIPNGARVASSIEDLATNARSVFLSLPDGSASLDVAHKLSGAREKRTATVIELSTIGISAARRLHRLLADATIEYIDTPVSGGTTGAHAGTVTLMWAGSATSLERHREILSTMAGNIFHVGEDAGQGQAMKLLNNFLSATAMAASSEAIAFGLEHGLDLETMLEVLNVSTGRNTATSDKFPRRILTGSYDSGFQTALMAKDMGLYLDAVADAGSADRIGRVLVDLWRRADAALPQSDFTRIYDFVRSGGVSSPEQL